VKNKRVECDLEITKELYIAMSTGYKLQESLKIWSENQVTIKEIRISPVADLGFLKDVYYNFYTVK